MPSGQFDPASVRDRIGTAPAVAFLRRMCYKMLYRIMLRDPAPGK